MFHKHKHLYLVGRHNWVVSFVIVFEELSHITSPSVTYKVNPGICLFYEQDFELRRHGVLLLSSEHMEPSYFRFQIWEE